LIDCVEDRLGFKRRASQPGGEDFPQLPVEALGLQPQQTLLFGMPHTHRSTSLPSHCTPKITDVPYGKKDRAWFVLVSLPRVSLRFTLG
jgi:hypothetical protein